MLSDSVGSGSAFVSTNSVTTNTPGTGSSITSTIVVSVWAISPIVISGCGVSGRLGVPRRLGADFFLADFAAERPDLALVFRRFALVLSGRLAACFFDVFVFLASFLEAVAFVFAAAARLVRLAITYSL